jgi:hypothetical protein
VIQHPTADFFDRGIGEPERFNDPTVRFLLPGMAPFLDPPSIERRAGFERLYAFVFAVAVLPGASRLSGDLLH